MSSKKQTAVEWLFEQVANLDWRNLQGDKKLEIFNQAKAMEMQYIMDAFIKGELNYLSKEIQTPKEYYNETYGN
jgi:hypothetical protein